MNGIISESESRSLAPDSKIASYLLLGACLFCGFALGITSSPHSLNRLAQLNPFRTETIHFDKITWISKEANQGLKIAASPKPIERLAPDLIFVPFELKTPRPRNFQASALRAGHKNFEKLDRVVKVLVQATRYNPFDDYRLALNHFRGEFSVAVTEPQVQHPQVKVIAQVAPKSDEIAMTRSSAEIASEVGAQAVSPVPPNLAANLPAKKARVMAVQPPSVNTQAMSIQNKAPIESADEAQDDDVPLVTTAGLSMTEQKKLTQQLLSTQLAAQTKVQTNQVQLAKADMAAKKKLSQNEGELPEAEINDAITRGNKNFEANLFADTTKAGGNCKTLDNQQFIMPTGPDRTDLASQPCIESVDWISKTEAGSSWVKVSGNQFLSTLTLSPAANGGATLLLDPNALGMISITSGVHVTKGMGTVVGRVPDGYKVSFIGRAEETEYFQSSGKNYFAILNAEPGAGVVALESKTNPNTSSTVFTPILGDTISYLDLVAPEVKSLNVRVVKNGNENDPEVAKLTVGLSTQSGIQAITRSDGLATLKDVSLVPGFPLFIDVSSKSGDQESYTYRYELKKATRAGVFRVNQVSEKSVHHWLSQVLSDQGAMVMGIYDRTKLDGFRNLHHSKVEPMTERFGLDPIDYSILWDGKISPTEPLEGDLPRFMSIQVPEGISQVKLLDESNQVVSSQLIPVSPRVIHVISE